MPRPRPVGRPPPPGNQAKYYAGDFAVTQSILAYTDVVPAGKRHAISFTAPATPGRYPFLCTFPGHWMVMNGELLVE